MSGVQHEILSADLAGGVPQALEPVDGGAQQLAQQPDLFERSPQGLRLVYVLAESGDEIWFAVCDRHRWLSIGGARTAARDARCTVCEAQTEADHRRLDFLRVYGPVVLSALFTAPPKG